MLIRFDADTVYQFLFATPPGQDRYNRAFRETTYSFRKLSRSETQGFQPERIDVVTVRSGDTVESLARRMKGGNSAYAEEEFRLIYGLDGNDRLKPGQKVKIIVAGSAEVSALPPGALAKQTAEVQP